GLEEYGSGPAPFVETQREAPRSAYSASQVAGTHLLQALQPTLPFAAVTLRPTLIYGPGQSTDFLIPALIENLLAGRAFPLSEGRQRRDLLHIDDLVTAMLAASTTDGLGGEVINVATGIARQIRTVARAIGRMLGRSHLSRRSMSRARWVRMALACGYSLPRCSSISRSSSIAVPTPGA